MSPFVGGHPNPCTGSKFALSASTSSEDAEDSQWLLAVRLLHSKSSGNIDQVVGACLGRFPDIIERLAM